MNLVQKVSFGPPLRFFTGKFFQGGYTLLAPSLAKPWLLVLIKVCFYYNKSLEYLNNYLKNIRAIKVLIASHISFSLKAVNRFIKVKSKFNFEVNIAIKLIHLYINLFEGKCSKIEVINFYINFDGI